MIAEGSLRNHPEHEFARGVELIGQTSEGRRNTRSYKVSEIAIGCDEGEKTVSRIDKLARECPTLGVVAVEKAIFSFPFDRRRELPCKVDRVADASTIFTASSDIRRCLLKFK